MPPLPDAAACVRVRVQGTVNGSVFNNIFHLQYTGSAPSVSSMNALCSAVLTAWATHFSPLCPDTVVLAAADAQDLTNSSASSGEATNTTAGTRAGTPLPNNVACCVSWHIPERYRGGHPRTYIPSGVIADVVTGNRWDDAFVGLMEAAATAFITAINAISISGATYKLICLSYRRANVPRIPPVAFPIQTALVDHRPDSQRKRLGKDLSA